MVAQPEESGPAGGAWSPRKTYEDRLRLVGRYLDLSGFRAPTIIEVEGGLLERAFPGRGRAPEALEFPYEGFEELLEQAVSARGAGDHVHESNRLAPTGYEDLLRAVGHGLDERVASAIVITECEAFLLVHGLEHIERLEQSDYAAFDAVLDAQAVTALLDAAFRRRTMPSQQPQAAGRSVLQSLGLQRRH